MKSPRLRQDEKWRFRKLFRRAHYTKNSLAETKKCFIGSLWLIHENGVRRCQFLRFTFNFVSINASDWLREKFLGEGVRDSRDKWVEENPCEKIFSTCAWDKFSISPSRKSITREKSMKNVPTGFFSESFLCASFLKASRMRDTFDGSWLYGCLGIEGEVNGTLEALRGIS